MLRTLGRRGLCGVPAGGFGHTVEVRSPGFLTLTLNRPEVHNAFSDAMITDLSKTFDALGEMSGLRGLFVRGAGKSFCAGADLDWMKRAAGYTRAQNEADALAISSMIRKIVELPCATVALVHGNAFGGGVGYAHAPATPRTIAPHRATAPRAGLSPRATWPSPRRRRRSRSPRRGSVSSPRPSRRG